MRQDSISHQRAAESKVEQRRNVRSQHEEISAEIAHVVLVLLAREYDGMVPSVRRLIKNDGEAGYNNYNEAILFQLVHSLS